MTDQEILNLHIAMVPFLSEVLGTGCEVVAHDITDPEHSVVAICNNLSGRNIGDPMTDLSLDEANNSDYVANYSGRSKGRDFLSSTYYIKNEGRLIGLLCVNKNVSNVQGTELAKQLQVSVPTIYRYLNKKEE